MIRLLFGSQATEHSAQNLAAMNQPMEVDLRFARPAHTIHRIRGMESQNNHHAKMAHTDPTPNPLLVFAFIFYGSCWALPHLNMQKNNNQSLTLLTTGFMVK